MGQAIKWVDIKKFHATHFFSYGNPAVDVNKSTLAVESDMARQFIRDVNNPKIWSDIKLVANPRKRRQLYRSPKKHSEPKRSRRILEMGRRTILQERKLQDKLRRERKIKSEKAARIEKEKQKQELRNLVVENIVAYANDNLHAMMQKMMSAKFSSFKKKTKTLTQAVDGVGELSDQVKELRENVKTRFEELHTRHERLLDELDSKIKLSVDEITTKLKKVTSRYKSISAAVTRVTKDVNELGTEVTKIKKKETKKRRRNKRVDMVTPVAPSPPAPEVTPNPPTRVVRPPTPMVPPGPLNSRTWGWNTTPQSFMRSETVNPGQIANPNTSPQYMSPVYGTRNFIR